MQHFYFLNLKFKKMYQILTYIRLLYYVLINLTYFILNNKLGLILNLRSDSTNHTKYSLKCIIVTYPIMRCLSLSINCFRFITQKGINVR